MGFSELFCTKSTAPPGAAFAAETRKIRAIFRFPENIPDKRARKPLILRPLAGIMFWQSAHSAYGVVSKWL
jgi:hypothetical protein